MASLMGDSGFRCLWMCVYVEGSGGGTGSDIRKGDHEKRGSVLDEGAGLTCSASR